MGSPTVLSISFCFGPIVFEEFKKNCLYLQCHASGDIISFARPSREIWYILTQGAAVLPMCQMSLAVRAGEALIDTSVGLFLCVSVYQSPLLQEHKAPHFCLF